MCKTEHNFRTARETAANDKTVTAALKPGSVTAANDKTVTAALKPGSVTAEFETLRTLERLCGLNEETILIPDIQFSWAFSRAALYKHDRISAKTVQIKLARRMFETQFEENRNIAKPKCMNQQTHCPS